MPLAIAVGQFREVPTAMLLTLAGCGVLVSILRLLNIKSIGDRIVRLDNEICGFKRSIHGRYLSDKRSVISRQWTFRLMTFAFPVVIAGAWILLAVIKYLH